MGDPARREGTPMLRLGTAPGRWVLAATVLGSSVAFLDSTVVNVALPSMAQGLDTGLAGIQWVVDGYLLTLGSLIVLGGALGDRWGRRRVFVGGVLGFMATSALCAVAPTIQVLVLARLAQGVAAAALVPGSLAIVSASFHPDDRGRAIGAWSGLAGIATAVGPFAGGWLIDAVSWRLVFLVNVPISLAAAAIALRAVPETSDRDARGRLDVAGALTLALGLAGLVYALIEGPGGSHTGLAIAVGIGGALLIGVFVALELRRAHPMVPMRLFRSRQFSGANGATLGVYAALSAATFFLVLHLQQNLGYSALASGAALLPATLLMFLFSERAGGLAQRIGPRGPMTVGPLVVAVGLVILAQVRAGDTYVGSVLPGVIVFGVGLTITVAPLTAAVLGAVEDRHAGLAAAINNAVARLAGLVAVALIPAVVGMSGSDLVAAVERGYRAAMLVAAALAAIGGLVSWLTIRRGRSVATTTHADLGEACHAAELREPVRR